VVEAKPRQTVMVMVSEQQVMIQGEPVVAFDDILQNRAGAYEQIRERLERIKGQVIGVNTEAVAKSSEVTIMAHRTVPFKALKSLMSSCTSAGYTKISLAVIQKASQN
jgi:biopolymer transport protein ExbD